jgi:hypothetical protein
MPCLEKLAPALLHVRRHAGQLGCQFVALWFVTLGYSTHKGVVVVVVVVVADFLDF